MLQLFLKILFLGNRVKDYSLFIFLSCFQDEAFFRGGFVEGNTFSAASFRGGDPAVAAAAAASTLWHYKDLSPPALAAFDNMEPNHHAHLLVSKVVEK